MTMTFVPSAYFFAYFPRMPLLKSYSSSMSGSFCIIFILRPFFFCCSSCTYYSDFISSFSINNYQEAIFQGPQCILLTDNTENNAGCQKNHFVYRITREGQTLLPEKRWLSLSVHRAFHPVSMRNAAAGRRKRFSGKASALSRSRTI